MNSIIIGIPTFRRVDSLARLLEALSHQQDIKSVRVIVVDNDPACSGKAPVKRYEGMLDLEYCLEPRPGVVHVRNMLLGRLWDADALIFLDDDQIPHEDWLSSLLNCHERNTEDVLAGPVAYSFQGTDDVPLLACELYCRSSHADGSMLAMTGTGNSLLPRSLLDTLEDPWFDSSYSLSGGEDTEFFDRVATAGVPIRWCASAGVEEIVGRERLTKEALRERCRRSGFVAGRVALSKSGSRRVLAGGVIRLAYGLLACCLPNSKVRVKGSIRAQAGIGRVSAVTNGRFHYYGRER